MNEGFGESWHKETAQPSPTPEELERRIASAIGQLPPDIARIWEKKLEDAEDGNLENLEKELHDALAKRREALAAKAPQFLRTESSHLVENREYVEETVSRIVSFEWRADLWVGEGQRGHVYSDPDSPGVCYKFIFNPRNYDEWNSIGKEAEFLETLEDFEYAGVRTPKLHALIDQPDTKVITMERLEGDNIKRIVEEGQNLPDGFDIDDFFGRLQLYIEEMHRRYNIYHRDLHAGNILVGKDGAPYVIDFGKAMTSPNEDWAYEITNRAGEHTSVLPTDEEQLKAAKSLLRIYIGKKRTPQGK